MTAALLLAVFLDAPSPPGEVVVRQGPAVMRLTGGSLDRGELALPYAELLSLTVEVESDGTLEVELKLERDAKVWGLYRQGKPEVVQGGPGRVWRQRFELEPVQPGKMPTPGVSLRYRKPGQPEWTAAQWPGVTVHVVAPEGVGRKDVRGDPPLEQLPPLPPPDRAVRYLGSALLALTAAGLSFLVVRRWLRRRPWVPLHERTLEQLGALEAGEPPAGTAPDWFHARLSQIVRGYCEGRFQLPATRRTTEEFLTTLAGVPEFPEAQRDGLRDLLTRCDLAKFAGLPPDLSGRAPLLEQARRLVLETTTPQSSPPLGGGSS